MPKSFMWETKQYYMYTDSLLSLVRMTLNGKLNLMACMDEYLVLSLCTQLRRSFDFIVHAHFIVIDKCSCPKGAMAQTEKYDYLVCSKFVDHIHFESPCQLTLAFRSCFDLSCCSASNSNIVRFWMVLDGSPHRIALCFWRMWVVSPQWNVRAW